jgi:hypothetical protein
MNQDTEHLKLLAIFHYVVGAVSALFACFPFIHFFIGLGIVAGWFPDTDPGAEKFGIFFMVIASFFILMGWIYAGLLIVAGRFLSRRQHQTFCLVVAGISCVFLPFGTVLGVFTIIVLMRPSVRELFGNQSNS